MKYREDKYGNKLSILGFGCMRFPKKVGKSDLKTTEDLIVKAVEAGINYFDTAYIYGDSEKTLGTILKKNKLRDKVFIATKLPFTHRNKKSDFDKCFNMQLKRLQTDYIDYYLIHMLTDIDMWNKLVDLGIESWIKEKKKTGKIKQIGFSFHGTQIDFLKIIDAYNWDFCQIQYNYMNENYQAGKVGLKKASELGIPVVIMEPLLGGKLVNLPTNAIKEFKSVDDLMSPVAWALKWLWNQKEVTLLLSGMNSMKQLEENISIANNAKVNMLTKSQNTAIKNVVNILNETYKIPCTGCNYCMPCPQGVNIPGCFASYNNYHVFGMVEGIKQYVMNVGMLSSKKARVSNCIRCGVCESKCPQNIKIRDSLEIAEKKLEPFWVKTILWIVSKFTK